MARAILTFEDDGPGRVAVELEFDPPASKGDPLTGAQRRAVTALRGARQEFSPEDWDYAMPPTEVGDDA